MLTYSGDRTDKGELRSAERMADPLEWRGVAGCLPPVSSQHDAIYIY